MNTDLMKAAVLLMSVGLSSAWAAEHVVEQKQKQFVTPKLEVKVGDSVSFKNSDEVNHNVFSLSDSKSFDLGSYPKGQARSVTFDKAGVVEVECAIHPDMRMEVKVK